MVSIDDDSKNEREFWGSLHEILLAYAEECEHDFLVRWKAWDLDLSQSEVHEVIGGLLARIATLATELSYAPSMWNHHASPIIFRSMVDAYIALAWIFKDPVERARKFIEFGLGQAKLEIEHRKAQIIADGGNPEDDPAIEFGERWINSQQYTFLTNVNIGNWAGTSTRQMAEEADCIDLYNYVYSPLSAATHNMWNHVARFNLDYCANPLHGFHRVPLIPQLPMDPEDMLLAAKYANKAFSLFDNETGIDVDEPVSYRNLRNRLNRLGNSLDPEAN